MGVRGMSGEGAGANDLLRVHCYSGVFIAAVSLA